MKTISLKPVLFFLLIAFFSCTKESPIYDSEFPVNLDCRKPDYLKAGDKVALISPSFCTPMENVEKTAEVLRSWGLEPVIGPNVGKVSEDLYAGTVNERISDIRWAFKDPSIKAIICNTGGYGSIQLIDKLKLPELKANPKWLVGFSDISTIHGLLTRAGMMSIHGTMSCFLAAGGTDATSTLMRDILLGKVPQYHVPEHPLNITGSATGILVGGNLCTFAANLDTQADATIGNDLILLIEEVGEPMSNIDRQMRILQMHGVLDRCKGIILGEFIECGREFKDESGKTISIESMLDDILAPYNIPVLCGFPAGHGSENLPLVMGAPVTIDVSSAGSTISFGIEGQQSEFLIAPELKSTKATVATRMMLAGKKRLSNNTFLNFLFSKRTK